MNKLLIIWMSIISLLIFKSEPNLPELVEGVNNKVVSIYSFFEGTLDQHEGSGFVIEKNFILTNAHVVEGIKDLRVRTTGGEYLKAYLVSINVKTDYAVLFVDDLTELPVEVSFARQVKVGESLFSLGSPRGLNNTVGLGVLTAKDRVNEVSNVRLYQTSVGIVPGSSGGPVFNMKGEVIGMVIAYVSGFEQLGLIIPIESFIDKVHRDIKRFKQGEHCHAESN